MNSRIKIVKEYLKTNSNLQIINEESSYIDIVSSEMAAIISEYCLPKDLFVFKINVSEKSFLKFQVYMKKVHNYNKISDRILTFFNMKNLVEDDENILVFSRKYVIDEEQLEKYIIKKLIGYFELEVGPYRNLIYLMKSLLPLLFTVKK
jgi:hypothetical protein